MEPTSSGRTIQLHMSSTVAPQPCALPLAVAELGLVRSYECVFDILRYASNSDHRQNDV
jgi:hypothetical protein